jgi:hypothetical protein
VRAITRPCKIHGKFFYIILYPSVSIIILCFQNFLEPVVHIANHVSVSAATHFLIGRESQCCAPCHARRQPLVYKILYGHDHLDHNYNFVCSECHQKQFPNTNLLNVVTSFYGHVLHPLIFYPDHGSK